jgi:citrate lyase subunit alpha/citrate CoA-transferase
VRKNYPTIVEKVTTITTPGDTIDVLVTEGGIAVNPKREDIIKSLEEDNVQLKSVKNLKEKCDAILGKKYMNLKTEKKIVGVVEYRDGTIIDVIRKVKE